jgi:hypothetical protein
MQLANVDTLTDNFLAEAPKSPGDEVRKATKGVKIGSDDPSAKIKAASQSDEKDSDEAPVKTAGGAPKLRGEANDESGETIEEEIDSLFEEEDLEGEDLEGEEEAGMEDMEAMDPEPEMGAEEPGAADMSLTEEEAQLLIDLGKRLEEAMGSELGGEEEAEMDADAGLDEPEMDMGAEEEVPAEEEEPALQEALVNEVLKRVTKRLVAAKLKYRK